MKLYELCRLTLRFFNTRTNICFVFSSIPNQMLISYNAIDSSIIMDGVKGSLLKVGGSFCVFDHN